jgi:tellurite resistance protein TerC
LCLALDLLLHRGNDEKGRARPIAWSLAWMGLALAFGAWVAYEFGRDAAEDYLTAYVLEKSLSVDNLFVFLVVFERLRIPRADQHRVLFWGILGALVTRGVFIAGGIALLHNFHWLIYVLGAFLVVTGVRTAAHEGSEGEGRVMSLLRRRLRITNRPSGRKFIVTENGVRMATPLLLALLVIEVTDIMFAADSIPAVFAVTDEPFIVYSSNVFAVLGMRALYVVLAGLLADMMYLRYGLGAILVFAGFKMLASNALHIPHAVSLLVVLSCLALSMVSSVIARRRAARGSRSHAG